MRSSAGAAGSSRPVNGKGSFWPAPCCWIRPVLVLDEATSQLDDPTARSINQKLHGERFRGTVIVIAHRVSTVVDLPRILVLDCGRITADGRHGELLRTSAKYHSLFAREPE